jgi:tripartite-type tricarboxylate transporter receptor subunit TctC
MNRSRRRLLHLILGAVTLPAASTPGWTQTYPSRPVRIIVGFPPGGDIVPRLMGQWLSERLGQPFIIENRPGGGSNIATEMVVNARADGYTLLMITPAQMINATLYEKLSYNFIRDIAPVASVSRETNVMVVNASFPAKTVYEFIAYAKAHPGEINMASAGNGTSVHVIGELFKMMTGINMVHVPYRGAAPAITDLISGQVQVMFATMPSSIASIRSGQLRALAVTSAVRSAALPDIPSIAESLPGYDATSIYGVGAPKNTPTEIIDKLSDEINAGLSDPGLKARLGDLGGAPAPSSPADFGKLIVDEIEKWAKVVRFAGIKAD